jgi:ppGpp synthetase/RelA/SpoT-type nucleotidyltranferase
MEDLQAARQRWQHDQPRYQAFLDAAAAVLDGLLRQNGIYGQVSKRTKALDSLLKKLLRKPHHTYETLSDKAAMRLVVRYASEISAVGPIIEGYFVVLKIDDKTASLAPDQFRYQGVHYDARLPSGSEFADLQLEIQVCTRAQNLWTDLSHDLAYKTVIDLPAVIHRQVHSLSALLEVVDREFDLIIQAIRGLPNAGALRILAVLERCFFRINPALYARDLSIDVITALTPVYPAGTDLGGAHFEGFVGRNAAKLEHVVLQNPGRSPFLSQPEIVMIFNLLDLDEFQLQQRWNESFPASELEQLAILWGKPLP